jgi:lysylphosphatidylglycerol synthetase-like protein (DUF2156 family)
MLQVDPQALREESESVGELVVQYGSAVSSALLDPACTIFRSPGIRGVIGYRVGLGCAVALGEPVCAPEDVSRLADAFRDFCKARGWHTTYAVAGPAFKEIAVAKGYAAVEFGEELILDPQRDPEAGSKGRELRKKVNHAKRDGLGVLEHDPAAGRDARLEGAMENVAKAWLEGRSGPQIFLAKVRLFADPEGKRWFYAKQGDEVVGVLTMLRLESRDGWLLDHLLATPDAPIGTTEILVTAGLAALRQEGCRFATFGAAPAAQLGVIENLSPFSETVARSVFNAAGRVFHLDARSRYRRKFQVSRTDPSFLLFDPPRLGLRETVGISRAFNVSLA